MLTEPIVTEANAPGTYLMRRSDVQERVSWLAGVMVSQTRSHAARHRWFHAIGGRWLGAPLCSATVGAPPTTADAARGCASEKNADRPGASGGANVTVPDRAPGPMFANVAPGPS